MQTVFTNYRDSNFLNNCVVNDEFHCEHEYKVVYVTRDKYTFIYLKRILKNGNLGSSGFTVISGGLQPIKIQSFR